MTIVCLYGPFVLWIIEVVKARDKRTIFGSNITRIIPWGTTTGYDGQLAKFIFMRPAGTLVVTVPRFVHYILII